MSRRAWLWIGFAVVHLVVAVCGFFMPNQPMGDVYFVYEPWAQQALAGRGIPGIDTDWIYPQLALIPMVLANGISVIVGGYEGAWAILVTACDALAFALLVGKGRSNGRTLAAWFWLGFALLLGPVGMYRLDAITVPLALAGCLWLVGRPTLAALLLAGATWIKVWPAALLAAALVAVRRRLAVVGGALIVTGLAAAIILFAGGADHAFSFVLGQTDRGLQLEAPVSAFYLWRAVARIPGSFIYYDSTLLTFQVAGPEVDIVIALMTPLLVAAMLAIAAIGALKAWRGASFAALFPPLALSFVLAFIVFNKVGSPQYLAWLIAPLAFGLVVDRRRWWRLAVAGLVAALLTQLVYPLSYRALLMADSLAASVLTLRNAVLVVMLVWAVVHLVRVPRRVRLPVPVSVTS
ncbi:MAG: hypothetical protein ABWY55_10670 [Microbacterium sp.]